MATVLEGTRKNIVIHQGDDVAIPFDVPELQSDDIAIAQMARWAGGPEIAFFGTRIDYDEKVVWIVLPSVTSDSLTNSGEYDLQLEGDTLGRRTVYHGKATLKSRVVGYRPGLPVRFPDVHFYYADTLRVRFAMKTETDTDDGLAIARLDTSPYQFTAVAKSPSQQVLDIQPQHDDSEAADGYQSWWWTQEQVAELPNLFWLEISETAILDVPPGTDSLEGVTWDEFPSPPIWDATILVGKFVKRSNGF
jgi:hypothetical protein